MMLFLSVLSPLGQALGMYLNKMNHQVQGVFLAIAAGTFLYIAIAEVIVEEFSLARNKYIKFLFYGFGVVFIVLITAYV